jgi:hypothetical protein
MIKGWNDRAQDVVQGGSNALSINSIDDLINRWEERILVTVSDLEKFVSF